MADMTSPKPPGNRLTAITVILILIALGLLLHLADLWVTAHNGGK